VWMVVTDSAPLRKWITETYGSDNNANDKHSSPADRQKDKSRVQVPREIVTTRSRGVHTSSSRSPSTTDFAEALIDWYLLGESDLVVTSNAWYSFGSTAALRTDRPLYGGGTCSRVTWINEG